MPLFKDNSDNIITLLSDLSDARRRVLFGDSKRFKRWLEDNEIDDIDPVRTFSNYLSNNSNNNSNIKDILDSWNYRLKITENDLKHHTKKDVKKIIVKHQTNLADRYLGKYPTYSDLLKDKIDIINKNQSAILLTSENKTVGIVIRDLTKKNVSEHFGTKIKVTIDAHYSINRGNEHSSSGMMVGHGSRQNRTALPTWSYSYKGKNLSSDTIKIYDNDGDTLGNWIYECGKFYLPETALSYDEFKSNVTIEDGKIIGAVFCTKNYKAVGHTDDDRSKWAIGYVYDEGIVEDGYFFYPEYGIAIEMSSNSMWCWLPQAVHGTVYFSNITTSNRYTAAITLTEKTAKALEKKEILEHF